MGWRMGDVDRHLAGRAGGTAASPWPCPVVLNKRRRAEGSETTAGKRLKKLGVHSGRYHWQLGLLYIPYIANRSATPFCREFMATLGCTCSGDSGVDGGENGSAISERAGLRSPFLWGVVSVTESAREPTPEYSTSYGRICQSTVLMASMK